MRVTRPRLGLVYYPLWVVRYLYRGRSFQVVVDGYSGEALYGKAPGNSWYRAAVLVGGMALGSVLVVDVPAFIINSSEDAGMGIVISAGIGIALMYAAWRTFRTANTMNTGALRAAAPSVFRQPSKFGWRQYQRVIRLLSKLTMSTVPVRYRPCCARNVRRWCRPPEKLPGSAPLRAGLRLTYNR